MGKYRYILFSSLEYPGVYTKVANYKDFIEENIK